MLFCLVLDHTSSFFATGQYWNLGDWTHFLSCNRNQDQLCCQSAYLSNEFEKMTIFRTYYHFLFNSQSKQPSIPMSFNSAWHKTALLTGGWKAVCGKRAVFDNLSTKNFLSQCQKQGQSSLNSYIYKAIIWMLIKNLNFKFATFLCLIHIQL